MLRKIVDFYTDENGDWVALLDCFHGQHVRHKPPFIRRPWVLAEQGRRFWIGNELDCLKCNRLEWPQDVAKYQSTSLFDNSTIPPFFKGPYRIGSATWVKIIVQEGKLKYTVSETTGSVYELGSGDTGVIAPETKIGLHPCNNAEFYLEFYTRKIPD